MREYLEHLIARDGVRVVEREVDPKFELAAVTVRSQAESDAPVLFRRVRGSSMPVVTNVYGSRRRLTELIGAEEGGFCARWQQLSIRQACAPDTIVPSRATDVPVRPTSLSSLPRITYFEKDAGPYLTAGIYLAKDPETGVPNLSFHRAMMVSDAELRVRLGRTHDLTAYHAKAEAKGEALECAILLGAPPPYVLAAAAPLAPWESEVELASKIAGHAVPMRRCRQIDLEVPTHCEIVVEGRILPNVLRPEAPFGEFQGYYVQQIQSHVFEVLGVTVRDDAWFHALVCGSSEDLRLLEVAIATQIYRALVARLPGVLDVACVPHVMGTVVKIRQQYEGHAQQVLLTAIGANHDWSKTCIVVDEDVDIDDFNDVWWAVLTRSRPDQRATILPNVPGFFRDPHKDHWGRLLIDATRPFDRQGEYERKRIPGADSLDLATYFGPDRLGKRR
ncbi:MAG: UbiD family decarboxylase [Burkholderiaceae bacterium]|nr:UbiD family decarboxylase [Burkholderiaceae bacterium]